MSERPEEPKQASDADSLLPIDEHVEEGHDAEGRKVRHRGIYLLHEMFKDQIAEAAAACEIVQERSLRKAYAYFSRKYPIPHML